MNATLSIRAKLTAATLALVLVCAFTNLHDIGTRSSGEAEFRIVCTSFSVLLAFSGVYGSAQLQLLWGWCLAMAAPALAALCVFEFRGTDLIFGVLAMAAAVVGGFLLLMDPAVRDYREGLRRRHKA
ncbi:MAG: hypothetical protein ABMA26_11115 [Limisphaerales bacterium]